MKPNGQPGALIAAPALLITFVFAASVSALPPQDHIALVRDSEGRAVYVNAADPGSPDALDVPAGDSAKPSASIRQLIGQTARSLSVDPRLVDAVVRVESGYDARARSPKGAVGLMQLVPATAARFGVQNPFDPAENIRGGVSYLGQLLRLFKGDVPLTLAAYNAGEGAVLRRQGIPPFEETQNYVLKVTAAYPASVSKPKSDGATQDQALAPADTHSARAQDAPVSPAFIYRYVDTRGVTHFVQ